MTESKLDTLNHDEEVFSEYEEVIRETAILEAAIASFLLDQARTFMAIW
jgi:hypothetical protein